MLGMYQNRGTQKVVLWLPLPPPRKMYPHKAHSYVEGNLEDVVLKRSHAGQDDGRGGMMFSIVEDLGPLKLAGPESQD